MKVKWRSTSEQLLIAIYGASQLARRQTIWDELNYISSDVHGGWEMFGDFNSTPFPLKSIRGVRDHDHHDMDQFRDFVQNKNLIDMGFQGDKVTWRNS